MSFAGVGPMCFLKSNKLIHVDADFIFQQDFATADTAIKM